MDISGSIRAHREAARLTQEEVAARAGMDRQQVSAIERDGHMPSVRTLLRLAQAIGVPASQIVALAEEGV